MASRSTGDRSRDLVAFASGLVFAASTPPIDFTPGILLGLGLFAASRASARRGFLFGLGANLVALRFVPAVIARFTDLPAPLGWVALLLLSAAQALPWLAGGALTRHLRDRRGVPGALAFAIGVYAATLVPALFPWTPAGGLSGWPVLLQTAEAIGERGASFALALGCALVAQAVATRHPRAGALGVATFASLIAYGALRMRAVEAERSAAPHARVALLQPDFDAMMRTEDGSAPAMLAELYALTRRAEESGAELTIWPESAYPYTLRHGLTRMPPSRWGAAVVDGSTLDSTPAERPRALSPTRPVITGAYLSKTHGVGTNSALLVAPDGAVAPSYDKRHLLWFGETIPLADELPILRKIFARGTGLDPGTESVALVTGSVSAAVLNCYEDTLPIAGREAMTTRPNLLVNVTNDAWFAGTAESELHLRTAVPRAIETRRDMVRAVNRGPTTWVDANGRVLRRAESAPGLGPSPPLVVDAALLDRPLTLYARAGEAPLSLLLLAVTLSVGLRHRRARRVATVASTAA